MPVEIIGLIATSPGSETQAFIGAPVDPAYVARFAQAHEASGFDRVLIGYGSMTPDNLQVAAYAAANTERLRFLVAHRPGVVFPTVAARTYATLDQFAGGRIALHTISGAADVEQRRDGDYLDKADRYARSQEYLQILKRVWTADGPVSHDGRFYRFEDYLPLIKPAQDPHIPIYFGGSSDEAYAVGAAEADVYALFAQPLAQIAEEIERVNAAAQAAGRPRPPRISVSFRPILGATEDEAWARAHRILAETEAAIDAGGGFTRLFGDGPKSVGSQRQLAAAAKAERHDRALWTSVAAATGAPGNTTALVGTPATVAAALLDYVDIGVSSLLIRGFDPFEDAVDYGRELIPLVREGVAARERAGQTIGAGLAEPARVAA